MSDVVEPREDWRAAPAHVARSRADATGGASGRARLARPAEAPPSFEDHGLALHSSSNWTEVGEYMSRFTARSSLTPLGERQRLSRFGGFQVGPLSFSFVDFGGPMRMKAEIDGDYHLAMCCLQGSAELRVDGSPVSLAAGQAMLTQPCMSIEAQFSADCRRLLIRVEPRLLPGYRASLRRPVSMIDPATSPWLSQINLILSSPAMIRSMLTCRDVSVHMEALLLALLRAEGSPYAPSAVRRSQVVSRDVRRAEAFIRLHATKPITLDDVVQASGASTRALQNNFMRFRQVSPMQYLRDFRLELVHEQLLDPKTQVSISEIALDCGFNHLGRFSYFYRARFGEAPSHTMRLAAHQRPSNPAPPQPRLA